MKKYMLSFGNRHGFTLIELSIVLVIIGLVVGGVLVGRDLLEAARMRATVRQISDLQTAVNTFRGKYNCLPGDCLKASSFGLGTDGFGTGLIGDNEPDEINLYFFEHLQAAHMLEGVLLDASSFPYIPLKLSPAVISGLTYVDGNNAGLLISKVMDMADGGFKRYGLTPMQAKQIDAALDDGLPNSGKIRAAGETDDNTNYPSSAGVTGNGTACVTNDTTPAAYNNLARNTALCSLVLYVNSW